MDGTVTHIATRECLITQPHPALECAIVTARRRCQEDADTAMRRQREDEQRQRKHQDRVVGERSPKSAAQVVGVIRS